MAKYDNLDPFERDALRIGLTLLSTDTQVRIETLEGKLGLPSDKSLGLNQRLARIEDEIFRHFPDE